MPDQPAAELKTFYEKYIFPNRVWIAWGLLIIISIITINIWLKSFKKDQTLDTMKQELKLKEQERQDIIAERKGLEEKLDQHNQSIITLNTKDSLLQLSVETMSARIEKIKTVTNEKIKAIEHYTSAELQKYYGNLPNDY